MSLFTEPQGRRQFLKTAGATGAGALAVVASGVGLAAQPAQAVRSLGAGRVVNPRRLWQLTGAAATVTDVNIANFALNLEYLEAEFYTMATTGNHIDSFGISTSGVGTEGPTTGGSAVPFNDGWSRASAMQIASDERAHVKLLQQLLGKAAIAKPAIDLGALGVGFGNIAEFLTLARAFEDTGVSAYGGAAPYITSQLVLSAAARILAIEGEHSANIRSQLLRKGIDNDSLGPLDSVDLPVDNYRFFSATSQGLATIRNPRQVLNIVFHSTGKTSGGFFPNGVNSQNLAGLAAIPAPDEYIWESA